MLRKFTLQPDDDKKIQLEGKFLVVTQATGPIELTIGGTTPITVDEKDRIFMRGESPNDRAVRIKNVSGGVNEIELHTSDLLVDKRASIDVKNSIAIADDQRIGIDPQSNIVQAIIQNAIQIDPNSNTVKAEVQNPVAIDSNQNSVSIENAISLFPGQSIGIDPNQNQVTVENALALLPGQTVQAEIINGVTLAPDQSINLNLAQPAKQTLPISSMIFENPAFGPDDIMTINQAGNSQRETLILTADRNNVDPVWLGNTVELFGTPIYPGDRLEVAATNEVTLSARIGQRLYLSEVVTV